MRNRSLLDFIIAKIHRYTAAGALKLVAKKRQTLVAFEAAAAAHLALPNQWEGGVSSRARGYWSRPISPSTSVRTKHQVTHVCPSVGNNTNANVSC